MHTFQTGLSRNWTKNSIIFKLLAYHRKEKESMYTNYFILRSSFDDLKSYWAKFCPSSILAESLVNLDNDEWEFRGFLCVFLLVWIQAIMQALMKEHVCNSV